MLRSQKPWILLAGLATVGGLLTTAQAKEQFGAAASRAGSVSYGNAGGDGGATAALQQELGAQWLKDVAAARRRNGARQGSPPAMARPTLVAPQPAGGQYVYLPSADAKDAKFLVIAGPIGTGTLSSDVNVKLATPPGATTLDVALFDGDLGGRWDQGSGVAEFQLFEDPEGDGPNPQGGDTPVPDALWTNQTMADNAWTQLTVHGGPVPISATAPSPSGSRFFFLRCRLTSWSPTAGTTNVFKIRTTSSVRLQPQNAFSVIGALGSLADAALIYPNYPTLTPTYYDGRWDFYVYVPTTIFYDPDDTNRISAFEVWDGDLDHGDYTRNAAFQDTDDLNTFGAYPSWVTQGSPNPEGVAVGVNGATGGPNDNHSSPLFRREPAITYDVTDPAGVRYYNTNPSGNQEWERFRIETRPDVKHDPTLADAAAPSASLPAGVFQVHIEGMDLGNLNAFRFEHDVLGVDASGSPVQPLLPFLIGDTVFADLGGVTGVQDPGEPGIPGVQVDLLDENGFLVESTTTDAAGVYRFNVSAGSFSTFIAPENFVAGGPLAGYCSTTGELLSRTVVDANVLTYDFGYRYPTGPGLGDRVWYDFNGDGVQDPTEPGIPGVTVELRHAATNALLSATTTDASGNYMFQSPTVTAGVAYRVRVVPPSHLTPTYDLDGALDHLTIATLPSPDSLDLTLDFGYRAEGANSVTIGDRVWSDLDGDGVQDPGEPGLGGIRLVLYGDADGNGSYELVIKCPTDGAGNYLHRHLPVGKYYVAVDTNSLPNGLALTFDPSSATPPSQGAVLDFVNDTRDGQPDPSLSSGVDLGQDFGYQGGGSLGDTVWLDANSDGAQNPGELGLPNVTLTLAGDTNTDGVNDYFASTTTNSTGAYIFNTLPAGVYAVTVDTSTLPQMMQQTYDLDGLSTPNQATSALLPRTAKLTYDFGYMASASPPASVGDTVWLDADANGVQDAGEDGIAGATVSLVSSSGATVATATTDDSGKYLFTQLNAGSYSVTVSDLPTGLTATYDLDGAGTVNRAAFTLANSQEKLDVDFGYARNGSVGDRVWNDVNRDGVQNSGESGIAGASVSLLDADGAVAGAATTDVNGLYLFEQVAAGNYTVAVTGVPSGFTQTFDLDGLTTAGKAAISLIPGEEKRDVDFGYGLAASVGDRVWLDADRDGVQDSGETGISGVTVTLLNADGIAVAETVTDADGLYLFDELTAGSYSVTLTDLPAALEPIFDLDGVETPDQAGISLSAGEAKRDVDFGYAPPQCSV
ncbi:MAG: SdrD B-like domain-containing protein, partial [Actinomycetota bacterium]